MGALAYMRHDMTDSDTYSALKRPVVLVGLMGAGKTTIGRRLARRLNCGFRDADEEIEAAAGRSVSEIFSDFGEAAFRDGERRVIARLLDGPAPMVLALGGGAFMNDETRALIARKAVSIWLKADISTLISRVSLKPGTRPLLEKDDPAAVMARLTAEREPVYALADITVDSSAGSHDLTVQHVLEALQRHAEGVRP